MERTIFLSALILALGSSVTLAASFLKEKTVVVPARGGNYTEGMLGQPVHINPVTASSEADKSMVRLLFANLGNLSDKITVDKEGKNWDVRLKENIRWSDGEKLTSDDAIFTVQKIQDPDSNSPLSAGWQGVGANRVSELEFRLTLGRSYAFFEKNIKELYVIPKHLFAETPVGNWRLSRYNLQPVGSGPYAFSSYEVRDDGFITDYHFATNKFYSGDRPLITDYNIKFFPNASGMISAFNAGQIDGFAMDSGEVSGINRPYETHNFFLPSYYAVFFNQGQNSALQDKKVRQALSVAVNRDALVKEVLDGEGEVRLGPFSTSMLPSGQGDAGSSSTNAGQILDEDGWRVASSSVRQKNVKGAIVDLEFRLTVPQIPFLIKTAEMLKSDWTSLGAKVEIVPLSMEEISGAILQNRDYQALLFGNMPNPPEDIFSFWHSSQRFYPGLNLSLYSNKQADNLITNIDQNDKGEETAQDIQNLQNMISGDYPAAFLYSPYYVYLSRKDLQGVEAGLIDEPADRFNNVAQWYIKTARSLK